MSFEHQRLTVSYQVIRVGAIMKYFASLCVLLLAGSMTGFAASAHPTSANPQNQFHFQPTGRRAAQIAAHDASARQAQDPGRLHMPASQIGAHTGNTHGAPAKNVRGRPPIRRPAKSVSSPPLTSPRAAKPSLPQYPGISTGTARPTSPRRFMPTTAPPTRITMQSRLFLATVTGPSSPLS